MSSRLNAYLPTLCVAALLAVLSGCAGCQEEGPLERAGKKADEAVEDAGDKMEDAADKVEDAVDN